MKPDFSGDYTLNRAECSLMGGAVNIESAVVSIEHQDPVFRYRASFQPNDGKALEYAFELSTETQSDTARLYWDGDALVNEFRAPTPGGLLTITWRYELVGGGMRAFETLRGAGRSDDNVWVFERQP